MNQVYNIANGIETSLADLYTMIVDHLVKRGAIKEKQEPVIGPPRPGDVSHSLASIEKAAGKLAYKPKVDVFEGLNKTVEWYYDKSVSE